MDKDEFRFEIVLIKLLGIACIWIRDELVFCLQVFVVLGHSIEVDVTLVLQDGDSLQSLSQVFIKVIKYI